MRRRHRVLSLLIALAISGLPRGAAAEDDASAHFERGLAFFKDADYTAAMVEFKKAHELDPNYRALYNLGQTSRELRDYAAALVAFERYLAEGQGAIKAERRSEVEGWVTELKGKVAHVTLKTSVAGAEIAVDDIAIGRTPLLAPVVMNAGRRKVAAAKSGYAPLTRFIDVAGTEAKEIELELVALSVEGPAGGPVQPAGQAASSSEDPPSIAPWIMLSITGAAGITAGVLGGVALGKKGDFDEQLTTFPGDPAAIEATRSDARAFAIAADVVSGVAGACGVTTIILFIVGAAGDGSAEEPSLVAEPPSVSVRVGPGYVGLHGTF